MSRIFRHHRSRPLTAAGAVAAAFFLLASAGMLTRDPAPLPDFSRFADASAKKQAFFDFLTPLVREENARIRQDRERLGEIAKAHEAGTSPGWLDRRFIARLTRDYGVETETLDERIDTLLLRVDVVPLSLALAQAAKESGWGTSRFARKGNNLFGQWCFEAGCGIVPSRRSAGKGHEVRAFDSVRASIASYLRNLNTHPRYRELRATRAELREAEAALSGIELAETLDGYSERGNAYVDEVQAMIRHNDLETLASAGRPPEG